MIMHIITYMDELFAAQIPPAITAGVLLLAKIIAVTAFIIWIIPGVSVVTITMFFIYLYKKHKKK